MSGLEINKKILIPYFIYFILYVNISSTNLVIFIIIKICLEILITKKNRD